MIPVILCVLLLNKRMFSAYCVPAMELNRDKNPWPLTEPASLCGMAEDGEGWGWGQSRQGRGRALGK